LSYIRLGEPLDCVIKLNNDNKQEVCVS